MSQACKRTHTHAHAHRQAHTHNAHAHNNNYKQGTKKMDDKTFFEFINTTSTKGSSTYNLKTQNCSKMARDILSQTKYNKLAKQHINSNIVQAYYNNAQFKQKIDDIMAQNNIVVVA